MKLIKIILIFSCVIFAQSQDKIPPDIQQKIDKGIDYYNLSLYEESKKIFLDLLYSDEGKKYEAEIRYHLGVSSFYEKNFGDARIQWKILIKKFPTNKHSKSLRRTADRWSSIADEDDSYKEENIEFLEEKKFGEYFWDSGRAEYKLIFGELKDPSVAVKYHEKLYEKYDDPNKKFEISLILFQLYSGINKNNYGYKNQSTYGSGVSDDPYKSLSLPAFTHKTAEILNQMEANLNGEFDINNATFILANYLWAVRLSDSEFWSEKAKSNNFSEPYFAKVIGLTNAEPNNIYRLFSIMYLGDNAKKYVISEKEMADYLSFGLTNDILIELIGIGIPKELWRDLSQRGYDFSTVVDDASFIRSVKIEKLLIEANLVEGYSFANFRSELKKFDGWDNLFTNHNFVSFNNKELLQWLETQFDCKEENCLLPIINSYKQNIGSELMLQSKKSSLQVQRENQIFIPFLPISTFIVMKLNDVSPKDFVTLFIENRDMLY